MATEAYIVALLNIHDRERYSRYEAGFMEVFSRHSGTLVAVDEAPDALEGEWPWTRTVIIRFPSHEAARQWFDSTDYQQLAEHRKAASVGNIAVLNAIPGA